LLTNSVTSGCHGWRSIAVAAAASGPIAVAASGLTVSRTIADAASSLIASRPVAAAAYRPVGRRFFEYPGLERLLNTPGSLPRIPESNSQIFFSRGRQQFMIKLLGFNEANTTVRQGARH
jgi:hypothetical protein